VRNDVLTLGIGYGRDMLSGNDEKMQWSLGVEVRKGHTSFILINDIGLYFAGQYIAEDTLHYRPNS
jgi:putative salt-induced outer membrane protein YdiY